MSPFYICISNYSRASGRSISEFNLASIFALARVNPNEFVLVNFGLRLAEFVFLRYAISILHTCSSLG